MSLDDKFNPNDGSLIDKLDSAIFKFNEKIAEKWQDKTHRRKEDLERILYFGSAAALGYYAGTTNYFMFGPTISAAIKGTIAGVRPKSSIHEEMLCESGGLPAKTLKYLNVLFYGGGIITTSIGIGCLVAGTVYSNNEFYSDSIRLLTLGVGVLDWASADYISKSNIGNPPPKPNRKPVSERIKEKITGFFPQPTPEPVIARMY